MATTINSTALDFNNIKSNLKTYLANQEEFKDYNFEASGLSNILDVLAYNTHINALIANFALNESYLPTAQLRSSAVSLAEGIGYIPDTDTAAQAKVRLTFNSNASGRPVNVTLPAYTKFTSSVDDIEYTFQTVETYSASDDGTGFYEFQKSDGSNQIPLFEGTLKTKTFIVGEYEDNPVYVIPDGTVDADTVTVKVFESVSSSDFTAYQNIENASTINTNSTVYILKESPNGFFELSFGDGSTLGKPPSSGNRIEVQYLSTKGAVANGASLFTPNATFQSGSIAEDLIVRTWSNSTGGQAKESIESIRANAPFRYATQNRMVTAADYSSLILRNYSTLISDIVSWGGQDALKPEFGAVYTSILFNDDVSEETKTSTKAAILDLAAQLSIVSFNLRFIEPVTTFIEVDTFFQFNPKLTDVSVNTIRNNVQNSIADYFNTNVGRFNQAFRRSGMLTEIDESSAAILSSRADVRMQQRFTPSAPTLVTVIKSLANTTLTNDQVNEILEYVTERAYLDAANYMINNNLTNNTSTYIVDELTKAKNDLSQELLFPVAIAAADDDTFTVTSNEFTLDGQTCVIKNKLSSTTLQVVTAAGGTVITDNLGSYNPSTGLVTINYFNPTNIARGETLIKLSVVPANQSVVDPTRNERLVFDADRSVVTTVLTEATN
tara:strand:+ start:335 stop:2335 length:2001 start_codon:yes stop_codon:yes gene_type:complete